MLNNDECVMLCSIHIRARSIDQTLNCGDSNCENNGTSIYMYTLIILNSFTECPVVSHDLTP